MSRPLVDKTFCQVFPDYDTFKAWYLSIPLSDNKEDCPSEKTYTLILYQYADSHIAFSEEGFKQKFAKTLYSYYKEFEKTTKAIDELMNLSDEDVAVANVSTLNTADTPEVAFNTNDGVEHDTAVDYTSQQQRTINRKGKMQVKREQLSNKRAYTVTTFLNRFVYLFIRILSQPYNWMWGDDNDDN